MCQKLSCVFSTSTQLAVPAVSSVTQLTYFQGQFVARRMNSGLLPLPLERSVTVWRAGRGALPDWSGVNLFDLYSPHTPLPLATPGWHKPRDMRVGEFVLDSR